MRPGWHLHTDAAHPDRRELVRLLLQESTVAQRGERSETVPDFVHACTTTSKIIVSEVAGLSVY